MRIPEDIARAIDHVARAEKIEKAQSLRKLARLGFLRYPPGRSEWPALAGKSQAV